jgi:ferritin
MPSFAASLNQQIRNEFSASQQYIAVAVYYDSQSLPVLAAHLLDADADVATPGIDAPQTDFADPVAPVALALGQEKRVTEQIIELVKLAREEGELVGEQFLHWFLQEQREEVASMTELLAIVERGKDNLLNVEEYLNRAAGGENPLEAGAPPAAGGAL